MMADEVSLGSDSRRSGLVISDPSIDGVHANIRHEGKSFVINDAGTVAGTWLNYEQVTSSGATLHHMDIIHLGRIGFRFRLTEPDPLPKISVTPLEPKNEYE
jgi:pSer/pThr/pTyr-binding forkhead associated (FHA) protein